MELDVTLVQCYSESGTMSLVLVHSIRPGLLLDSSRNTIFNDAPPTLSVSLTGLGAIALYAFTLLSTLRCSLLAIWPSLALLLSTNGLRLYSQLERVGFQRLLAGRAVAVEVDFFRSD